MDYPEHDKMLVIEKQKRLINQFLWFAKKNHNAKLMTEGFYDHRNADTNAILDDFFKLDYGKLEEERKDMIKKGIW